MKWFASLVMVMFLGSATVLALDNGLGLKPPMGWNSWFALGCSSAMNATNIRIEADLLEKKGLFKLGLVAWKPQHLRGARHTVVLRILTETCSSSWWASWPRDLQFRYNVNSLFPTPPLFPHISISLLMQSDLKLRVRQPG